MARAQRAKFIRKFANEVRKRSAAGIERCEIRFDRRDWQQFIEVQAVKDLRLAVKPIQTDIFGEGIKPDMKAIDSVLAEILSSPNWNSECDRIWADLGDKLQAWSIPKNQRTTWNSKPMTTPPGSDIYKLEVFGEIFFGKSTKIKWVDNVIVSIRKVAKAYAASIKLNKKIVAEHGLYPEKSQAKGQQNIPGVGTVIGGDEHQRGGGQGNVLQTALLKSLNTAVGKATKDPIMKVWVYLVDGILTDIWASTLDKRKSPNTVQREHTIHLTILPDESQTGVVDRRISQSIKKYFKAGGEWERQAKNYFVNTLGLKTRALNNAMSASDDYTEELNNTTIKRIIQGAFYPQTVWSGKKGGGTPNMKLKINKQFAKKIKSAKSSDRLNVKKPSKASAKRIQTVLFGKKATGKKAKKSRVGKRAVGRVAESPIALRNLLNEGLPQMVASKMHTPALQYRTGRFANSARVEMVHVGQRGGTQVDYTYMKFPYQTFEPGFKQGSTMRDPRKIIGESIRELAMGILGRQPHTIRRT